LGGRKGTWPVKTEWLGTGMVICLQNGENDLHMVQLMPFLASTKSRMVLPFGCQLIQVVLEKGC